LPKPWLKRTVYPLGRDTCRPLLLLALLTRKMPAAKEKLCIAHQGQELGEFSPVEIAQMLANGEIDETAWFWIEGMPEWLPVKEAQLMGQKCADLVGPPIRHQRLLINSVPKSGTYLIARYLDVLGAPCSGLHLRSKFFWDFKDKDLDEVIRDPDQFKQVDPLENSIPRIGLGEYFLAHLEYNTGVEALLEQHSVRHIFLYRKIRDVLVSHFRFICDERRTKQQPWLDRSLPKAKQFTVYLKRTGLAYMEQIKLQAAWIHRESALSLNFESLMGDSGRERQTSYLSMVADAAGIDVPSTDCVTLFERQCLGATTRTYSGKRSSQADVWSKESEDLFIESGGQSLEQAFG
jgi:hypothetical protein